MTKWLRRAISVAFVGMLACAANADGEPCSTNSDCESGFCSVAGKCGHGDCACQGDECGRVQSTCPANAVCWQPTDPLQRDYRICRFTCDAGRKCASGQHCEEGTCAPGAEPLALTWELVPQSCRLRSPCTFRIQPPQGAVVKYTWTLQERGKDAATEETNVPELVYTFVTVGIFEMTVVAHGKDGATGQLTTSTSVCVGPGGSCASGAPCCSGACTSDNICR